MFVSCLKHTCKFCIIVSLRKMFAHQKPGLMPKKKNPKPRALSDIPELGWKEKFDSVCIEVCIPADSQALHLSSFYSLKLMSHCHLNRQ